MKLIESIASYTGESRRRIEQVLTDDVKGIIAQVARKPEDVPNIDSHLLSELIEMDVFTYCDGKIRPNTAIFYEEDIKKLYDPVFKMGEEMAEIVKGSGDGLKDSSPNIRNFIGSIMGMGQGLHTALKSMNLAISWQTKSGKYEKSKVDFNQECKTYRKFGDDLQIKGVHRGRCYTSVTIGAGYNNYCSYLWGAQKASSNKATQKFYNELSAYLTDTFPSLITGRIQDEALKKIAQSAYIEVDDTSSVITKADARIYQPVITKISEACTAYYLNNIKQIEYLLRSTIVGQQGVPVENMSMNLWRYMRKAIAISTHISHTLHNDTIL